ncbi:hypothetical protein MOE90_02145 [Bacillus spizizenii]|nr:hypothetical protein [Bacillus spizizenii]MCY9127422.1 hypothetical protein [Bacillus spizizenii]
MGYYTDYKLEIDPEPIGLLKYLTKNDLLDSYLFYALTDRGSEMKWYDHEDDMKDISKAFPEALFTLNGDGEESGDVWRKYFKNGKMQTCRAGIVFDEYDEKELR